MTHNSVRVTRSASCPDRLGGGTLAGSSVCCGSGSQALEAPTVAGIISSRHPLLSSSVQGQIHYGGGSAGEAMYSVCTGENAYDKQQRNLQLENEMLHRKLLEKDAQIFLLRTSQQQPNHGQATGYSGANAFSPHLQDNVEADNCNSRNAQPPLAAGVRTEHRNRGPQLDHHKPEICAQYFKECKTMFEYLERILSIRFTELVEKIDDRLGPPTWAYKFHERYDYRRSQRSQSAGASRPSREELEVYGEPWLEGNRLRRNSELVPCPEDLGIEGEDNKTHETISPGAEGGCSRQTIHHSSSYDGKDESGISSIGSSENDKVGRSSKSENSETVETRTTERGPSSTPVRRSTSTSRFHFSSRSHHAMSAPRRLAKVKKKAPMPSLPSSKYLLPDKLDKISKGIIDVSIEDEIRPSEQRHKGLRLTSSAASGLRGPASGHSSSRSLQSRSSFRHRDASGKGRGEIHHTESSASLYNESVRTITEEESAKGI
eukprot:gb/GECG01010175.1/.p1 GENE.gb/GECG01010175.1/~~gb/GECG01010175.1/.p1  ORF type:complete len:489 (+),score=56.71 gb/GECG01010175.1/:1-1467(+)